MDLGALLLVSIAAQVQRCRSRIMDAAMAAWRQPLKACPQLGLWQFAAWRSSLAYLLNRQVRGIPRGSMERKNFHGGPWRFCQCFFLCNACIVFFPWRSMVDHGAFRATATFIDSLSMTPIVMAQMAIVRSFQPVGGKRVHRLPRF